MDILEILRQRLKPVYPDMSRYAPMSNTHDMIVNRQAAGGGNDGSILSGLAPELMQQYAPKGEQTGLLGSGKNPEAGDQHLQAVSQQRPNDDLARGLTQAGMVGVGAMAGAGGGEGGSKGQGIGMPAEPVVGPEIRPDGLPGGLMGSGVTPDPLHGGAGAMQKYGQQAPVIGDHADHPGSLVGYGPGNNVPYETAGTLPKDPSLMQPLGGMQSDPSTATRPRIVPGQPINGMPQQPGMPQQQPDIMKPLTRRQKIEQDIAEIEGKDYSPAVYRDPATGETSKKPKPGYVLEKEAGANYDKKHNILDVLRGMGMGALKGAQSGGGIAGMIGGAAGGGIAGAVDRNADNKMMDEFKLSGLQGDLAKQNEYEIGGFKRDKAEADAAEAQAKPGRENAKAIADIQEKQAKIRIDALKETLGLKYYDPKRPDHRAIAQQAGIDPDQMPAYDDRGLVERELEDGTKTKIKGEDVWKEEQATARGQVARDQDITKFNANNELEVQKKNVDNAMKYSDDVRQVIMKTAEANADLVNGSSEAQTANSRVQKAHADIIAAQELGDDEKMKAANADFDKAVADFGKAIGKANGGQTLAAQLKKAIPARPPKITYEPVKAASTGKRPVSKAKDPLGLFR